MLTVHPVIATGILLAQEGGSGSQQSPLGAFLPLIFLVGIFWFLIMRPQQRKVREQRELLSALEQGDRIVAAGGIVGTIRRVDEDTISLQVADNVVIKVDRGSVSRKLPD